MALLTADQIDKYFSELALEWAIVGAELELSKKFDDFAGALAYVNELGAVAESMNHHPEIRLGYGSVDVNVTTHSAGGLTKKDFDFAKAVEKI